MDAWSEQKIRAHRQLSLHLWNKRTKYVHAKRAGFRNPVLPSWLKTTVGFSMWSKILANNSSVSYCSDHAQYCSLSHSYMSLIIPLLLKERNEHVQLVDRVKNVFCENQARFASHEFHWIYSFLHDHSFNED